MRKTRNILIIAVALVLSILNSGAVAQDRKPELLRRAAEVAQICADHMPNSRAAKDAFKQAGYRYEGVQGRYHIYSLNSRRLIGATSITSNRTQMCMVSVSGMTPEEAMQLIRPWLAQANAQPAQPWTRKISTAWSGAFKGGPVRLGIADHINFRIMRGAAIFAVSAN